MTTSTALSLPERATVALGTAEHEVKLIALAKESTDIVAVTNAAGRDQAHRIGMNLRTTRTTIQNIGKDARDDATKFSKAIIAEENRLIGIIQPEETRVIGLRDGFDAEEKARKDAKIAAERARVDAIKARITAIWNLPAQAVGKKSADISFMIGHLVCDTIDDSFAEFADEAKALRLGVLDQLASAETVQRGIEIQAESDRQEAARVAAQAKADREELAAAQAKLKADREAQAEIARIAKAESDRAAAALKAAQDELNAKIAAHEATLAAEAKAKQDVIDAAIRLDADHAEALELNAGLDSLVAIFQEPEPVAIEAPTADVAHAPIMATWDISLDTTCPHCSADVDLLDNGDFWTERHFDIPEHGTDRTKGVSVNCPECMMDFKVDLEY